MSVPLVSQIENTSVLTFDTFRFFNSSTFNPLSRRSLGEGWSALNIQKRVSLTPVQCSMFDVRCSTQHRSHPFRRRYCLKFRQEIPVIPVQKSLSVPATKNTSVLTFDTFRFFNSDF
jgi:hypothetical protein